MKSSELDRKCQVAASWKISFPGDLGPNSFLSSLDTTPTQQCQSNWERPGSCCALHYLTCVVCPSFPHTVTAPRVHVRVGKNVLEDALTNGTYHSGTEKIEPFFFNPHKPKLSHPACSLKMCWSLIQSNLQPGSHQLIAFSTVCWASSAPLKSEEDHLQKTLCWGIRHTFLLLQDTSPCWAKPALQIIQDHITER